ncbi:MAG: hypothetical protein COA96_09455 [SAR86 cluster bacterium]|uniref:Uncharacterized protein n=1 Tax=SAR86 cluster bacterium TaxID=2030880 RepID=A0A2A5AYU7_9GAMM|nr:MAG: hypothetical protein COA96_09455 [SAR86 cluster bacterium]
MILESKFIAAAVISVGLMLGGCSEPVQDSLVGSADFLDQNDDGVEDIIYEFEGDFYYELVDRNFDGEVDESHKYGLDDRIVSSKVDSNLDGYLETSISYEYGSVSKVNVDRVRDGLVDISFIYAEGEVVSAEKYYHQTEVEAARIGKIAFEFGYPISNEVIGTTEISSLEFSNKSQ